MSKFIMTTEWPGGGSYSKFTKEELTKVLEEMGVPYQTINRLFSMVKSERYKGDSEYDMGPNWDYDEYPPENL